MDNNGFIDIKELLTHEYGFDGKNLFFQPYIELETVGVRHKFWFNYQDNMFLYKKINTIIYEAYGELLSQDIADCLGIDCAKYTLAEFDYEDERIDSFKNSKGVITHNFLKPGEKLVPIGEMMSQVTSEYIYSDEKIMKLYNVNNLKKEDAVNKLNNLEDIWPILDRYFMNYPNKDQIVSKIMDNLVKIYFFDIITLQGDRHIWNFGIIIDEKGNVRTAPIFDNSNMCNLNRPKTVNEFMTLVNNKKNNDPEKVQKRNEYINKALYHSTLRFSVSESDFKSLDNVDKKINQLDTLKYFLSNSSLEYSDLLMSYIENIENIGIDKIIENREENLCYTFEEEFKNYIITTINMNLNNIKEIVMENSRGKGGRAVG